MPSYEFRNGGGSSSGSGRPARRSQPAVSSGGGGVGGGGGGRYGPTHDYEDEIDPASKSGDRRNKRTRRKLLTTTVAFVSLIVGISLLVVFKAGGRRVKWRDRRRRRRTTATAAGDDEDAMLRNSGGRAVIGSATSPSGKYRWTDARQLPPLPGAASDLGHHENMMERAMQESDAGKYDTRDRKDFKVHHGDEVMEWEADADDDGVQRTEAKDGARAAAALADDGGHHTNLAAGTTGGSSPRVDYTSIPYSYPSQLTEPPLDGTYPVLEPLGALMKRWPQDDLDNPPDPIVERLQHFDYTDPAQVEMALKFRKMELPFKVYNVPEVVEAGKKWTDEYVGLHFNRGVGKGGKNWLEKHFGHTDPNNKKEEEEKEGGEGGQQKEHKATRTAVPKTKGHCQEATGNFFAFFQPLNWDVKAMGPPPTMDNDWTYAKWAKHARYADRIGLEPSEPHYYWQAGIPREERLQPKHRWTFVSRDLPSFSSPEPTFFGFEPSQQKGIQCRFGERGVTAATHYDAGRNMVAMMVGAKRYVLSPPKACPKLGIVTKKHHPVFRHSLLNFGYLNLLDLGDNDDDANENDPDDVASMPPDERAWLEVATDSPAIDTVLKAGEVLYIPSHWFHYITSLQKSAQCNTRSGRERAGTVEFGGYDDVMNCVGEGA